MERHESDNSLAERIGASARPVVLLRGPARSGKTTAALSIYRRMCDATGRPRCLLIAPNAPAAAAVRRALLEASDTGVLLAPQISTFAALAGNILAEAGHNGRMLPAFQRRLLLRRIVDELTAARRFSALSAVADTPGLIVAIDRAIAELKRAAVEPDLLASAIGKNKSKSRDLLEVYRRYQQVLLDRGVYDMEGRMWQARDCLAAASDRPTPPGLSGIEAAIIDGFTDFTPTQLEILRLMSGRMERMIITLPIADDGRERMWHWAGRTLGQIRRTFGEMLEEIEAEPIASPLRVAWDCVFDIDATTSPLPDGIELIAACDPEAEVAAAARRVKRKILDRAQPKRIAVLARSLKNYRPAIERIFAAHDIPIAPGEAVLTDIPVVRFVLDVAAMAPQFAFRDVLRVIGNSYFRPQSLGPYGPGEVVAAQMLIREGNVLAGRDSYGEAAERMTRRLGDRRADDEDGDVQLGAVWVSPETLAAARNMLETLFDLCEAAGDATGILQIVEKLALRLSACDCSQPERIARDLRALAQLDAVLSSVTDSPPVEQLREALSAVSCPPARAEAVVDVLDVLDARAMRYDHVVLMGLAEGGFPPKFSESSLIGEVDRSRWRTRGVHLDSRGDLTAREMLLFYLAVSRAESTLTATFRDGESAGSAAGPFLLSLLDPFGGFDAAQASGRLAIIQPGQFLPEPDEIATAGDAFNAAVTSLFRSADDGIADTLGWAIANRPEQFRLAARGLLARHGRYSPGRCDRFDGRITDPALLEELARRYPDGTVFSASRLNTFGQCPWQFFGRYVLKLAPLTEPQRRLEPVEKGNFVHNVLFRVMTTLRAESESEFSLSRVEADHLLGVLDQAVETEARIVEARRPCYPVLWRIQKEQMRAEMAGYLTRQRTELSPDCEHLHFELAFGMPADQADLLDADSRTEPFVIPTPAGAVRIHGKIDRIDAVRVDGERGLLVVDYKTGQLCSHKDIDAGRNLQLPIYAEAAEAMGSDQCFGGVFHQVARGKERHFSSIKPPKRDTKPFAERRKLARETIGRFVEAMSGGRFDVLPTHDCPSYCPYRQICHFSPARARIKTPNEASETEARP